MLRLALLLSIFVAFSLATIPVGKPLNFYARNATASGTIAFTNILQDFGVIGAGTFPNTFSVDTSLGFVWRTPITVQWTYFNGTYTILPNFDNNGSLTGFNCFYDPQKPYPGEITDHSTVVKFAQFLIPNPVKDDDQGNQDGNHQRDVSVSAKIELAKLGQVKLNKFRGYPAGFESNIPIPKSGRSARDDDNYVKVDYSMGWSRDAAACTGALAWAIYTNPKTDRFVRIDYSGTVIQPFIAGNGTTLCCAGAVGPIQTGLYEFTSSSATSDRAALTLDPMCYAGSPLLLGRYCDLGCHM
jgi:hypothetical protein